MFLHPLFHLIITLLNYLNYLFTLHTILTINPYSLFITVNSLYFFQIHFFLLNVLYSTPLYQLLSNIYVITLNSSLMFPPSHSLNT